MITASQVKELKTVLKAAPCFSEVELVEVRDEEAEVEFSVNLSTSLAVPFEEQVGDLVSARGPRPADNDIAAVLEALLLPHLLLDKFEIELEDDVDAESPVLPETVTLVVRISPVKKSKKGAKTGVKKAGNKNKTKRKTPKKKTVKTKKTEKAKNKKSLSKSRPDFAPMTDLERKEAVRLRDERYRSRERRAKKKQALEDGGSVIRNGRRGYVEQVRDPATDLLVWQATPEGAPVMSAMDDVWEKTISTGPDLAQHLNASGLKTLTGKPFTRNMMTDLVRHLDRLRRTSGI